MRFEEGVLSCMKQVYGPMRTYDAITATPIMGADIFPFSPLLRSQIFTFEKTLPEQHVLIDLNENILESWDIGP